MKQKLLNANALHVLDPLPPSSPPRSRVLSEAEIDRLFKAADHPQRERVRLFLWLALHTAARRTAIQELRWDQVDFDIDVIHYLPDGAVQSRKRKASVPISETLKPVLEEAWTRRISNTSLVIGSGGKINEPLRLVAEKAGVKGVTPHVMRHTAATIMARSGVSIWVIAQVLGNTVEQVEKVYAKWPSQRTCAGRPRWDAGARPGSTDRSPRAQRSRPHRPAPRQTEVPDPPPGLDSCGWPRPRPA